MSSHHFVKEGQEPALLIIDRIDFSEAEGLLQWAPLVMVTTDALEGVLLWGIKIDVVVTDSADTRVLAERLEEQAPVKIFSAAANPVDFSLTLLSTMGQSAVSILCKAFSDTIRTTIEKHPSNLLISVVEEGKKWSFIRSGSFRKWLEKDSHVYFIDDTLVPDLPGAKKFAGGYKISEDQLITIQKDGAFWLGEDN